MFQRLLICTDFCDGLHRMTQFVPSLAAGGFQQVTFLHCVPVVKERSIPIADTAKMAAARDRLQHALQQLATKIDVQVKVESGQPINTILSTAQAVQADLILLGTQTRSLLTEKLFGSTLMEVVQRSTVPVMSVRPQLINIFTAEELELRCRHLFRSILIPYNDTGAAQYLIQQIEQLAQNQPKGCLETLHLCWVVEGLRRREVPEQYQIDHAQPVLAAVKAKLTGAGLQTGFVEVLQGEPVIEVLQFAQRADVSAIAITANNFARSFQWSVPSFTSDLLRQSWHPLIYFPKRA
jgi:nucleotide-binding universal stress UspA family protein